MSNWANKIKTFKKPKSGFRAEATHVCIKHKYNSKRAGRCPICRQPLKCLGYRHRIGRHGEFTKKENFTKSKLDRRKSRQHLSHWASNGRKREAALKRMEEQMRLRQIRAQKGIDVN